MSWVGVFSRCFVFLGLSPHDDVVERRNASAAPATAGAMLAVACCYAGGNVGDGPGWWVVVFAGLLATGALFLAWYLLESIGKVSDAVTVERDVAAGWRLGGLLLALGLIFGRGVAGDWVSAGATCSDFVRVAWPAVPLVVGAGMLERSARPTVQAPVPAVVTLGVLPAFVYLGLGWAYVTWLGIPS